MIIKEINNLVEKIKENANNIKPSVEKAIMWVDFTLNYLENMDKEDYQLEPFLELKATLKIVKAELEYIYKA